MTSSARRAINKDRHLAAVPATLTTLTVKDRLLLLESLPKEGNLTTIRIVRELREQLSFSEEETAALGFQYAENLVNWNQSAPQEAEIAIGPVARSTIVDTLKRLNEAGKVTEQHLDLFERFGVGAE